MLIQLADFLIKAVGSFFLGLFLFRFYCLLIKCNLSLVGGNLSQFIFKLTDWSVLPLRKVLPKFGNFDLSTFLSALGIQYLMVFAHYLLLTGQLPDFFLLIVSLFDLISFAISALTWLVIIYAISSWVSLKDEIRYFFDRLVFPLLSPIRKVIPPISGLDLSAFFLLMALQVINIVVINFKYMLFGA
jgi:YggT family protein